MAGIDRVRDQLVKSLQFDMHNYVRTAIEVLDTPTKPIVVDLADLSICPLLIVLTI